MFHVERDLGGITALPNELEPPAAAAVVSETGWISRVGTVPPSPPRVSSAD